MKRTHEHGWQTRLWVRGFGRKRLCFWPAHIRIRKTTNNKPQMPTKQKTTNTNSRKQTQTETNLSFETNEVFLRIRILFCVFLRFFVDDFSACFVCLHTTTHKWTHTHKQHTTTWERKQGKKKRQMAPEFVFIDFCLESTGNTQFSSSHALVLCLNSTHAHNTAKHTSWQKRTKNRKKQTRKQNTRV